MTDTTLRFDTTAAGQLLGYILQLPRALCRLLEVGPGGAVGVEVLGDVTAYLPDGESINEEDKSSVSGNPLTDRATDLWKTFYNWIKLIEDGSVDPDKTRFVLYCNQKGRESLVNQFTITAPTARVARLYPFVIGLVKGWAPKYCCILHEFFFLVASKALEVSHETNQSTERV